MSSLENKFKSKGKLSLQKKSKKSPADLVNIIKNPGLNETCEFRSVEKMNKFFSGAATSSKAGNQRRGRNVKKNLENKTKMVVKDEDDIIDLESIVEDEVDEQKINKNENPQNESESRTDGELCIIEETEKQENAGSSNGDKIEDSDSQGRCTACGECFSSQDMAAHLQSCLKARFQRGGKIAMPAVETRVTKPEELETFYCQFCQKDLTKMSSQRRTQHLNKCMDKEEEEQKQNDLEKKALEEAKSMVLDCPMCGKVCKTENARKVHVKKCCQKLNIPTEQMLKLVKKQEDDHHMMLAAGVLPKALESKLKIKGKSTGALTKTKKVAREPKSQYDADLQMAMAISMSEAKPVVKTEPKKGKKKGPSAPGLLVALSKEEKRRRLSQRITAILLPEEEGGEDEHSPDFVSSSLSFKYSDNNSQAPVLWKKCGLQEDSDKENMGKDLFYVKCLVPPIEVSKVKPGSKVRRMSEIPGRDSSFMKPQTPVKPKAQGGSFSRNRINQSMADNSIVASTQTVVVLAELAADASQVTYDMEPSQAELNCSGFCPELPIVVQSSKTSSLLEQLQSSMLSMVNNPTHSDLQILTAGNDTVYCHKAILQCRCPELIKLEESGTVSLKEFGVESITSLVRYIYGGLVSVTDSCLADVISLVERFELNEFLSILQDLQTQRDSVQDPTSNDLHSRDKTSVESLLRQLWSDSDGDSEVQGQDEGDDEIDSGSASFGDDSQFNTPVKALSNSTDRKQLRWSEDSDSDGLETISARSKRRKIFKSSPRKNVQEHSELESQTVDSEADEPSLRNSNRNNSKPSPCTKVQTDFDLDSIQNMDFAVDEPSLVKVDSLNIDSGGDKKFLRKKSLVSDDKLKDKSIIYENDDLEVYSNVSSSEKSFPSENNGSQNHDPDLSLSSPHADDVHVDIKTSNNPQTGARKKSPKGKKKIIDVDKRVSPKSDINALDREYSPEIPLFPTSPSVAILNQSSVKRRNNKSPATPDSGKLNTSQEDDLPSLNKCKVGRRGKTDGNKPKQPGSIDSCKASENDSEVVENLENQKNICNPDSSICGEKEDCSSSCVKRDTMHESFDDSNDSLIILGNDIGSHGNRDFSNISEVVNKVDENPEKSNTSLNVSGGDLFASPSPVIQRSRSQCPSTSQNVDNALIGSAEKLALSPTSRVHNPRTSRTSKRKTLEMESPTKLIESSKRAKTSDSNDGDISIVGDNFSEVTSKLSPQFKPRERKWKFTSKTDFVKNADITFSGAVKTVLDQSSNNISNQSYDDFDKHKIVEKNVDDEISSSSVTHLASAEVSPAINNYKFNDDADGECSNAESDEGVNLIDAEKSLHDPSDKNNTMEYDMDVAMVSDCVSHDDVWEDFDDCGAGAFGGIVHCETPGVRSKKDKPDLDDLDNCKETELGVCAVEDGTEFENLTFCDESFMEKVQEKSFTKNLQNFKTPVMPKRSKQKNRVWQEPSPFTPMPNYDDMATPVIKKHVQNYGVKPVGKKRMVKLLKDIYHKTHQYETDSEFEDDIPDIKTNDVVDVVETEDKSDNEADDMSFNDSQESPNSDMLEETYIDRSEDDNQPLKPGEKSLTDKLMEFISQQPELQVKILMYEPLELDILKQKVADAGIKCGMEKLKEFLDDKCITFTMKNMRRSPRKKKRSPKKAKPSSNGSSPAKKSPKKGRGRGKKKLDTS